MFYHKTIHKCNKVKDIFKVKHQIEELTEALLKDDKAIALAAPQIGWNARVFAIKTGKNTVEVFINPKIIKARGPMNTSQEGCRSLQELGYMKITRYGFIKLEWSNSNKIRISRKFFDFDARVIQHEYEHLEGIMISDHIWPKRELK